MSLLERQLPEPNFVDRDVSAIVADVVADFEKETGRTLYPAQVERLMANIIAYRESLLREAIQDAAKLNLLRYSRAPVIDMLGELVGVSRLPAAPAGCTLRFTVTPLPQARTIPAGTLAQAGAVAFATTADVVVAENASTVDITALCVNAGVIGNGFVAGQVNTLAAPIAGFTKTSVANTDTTAGGTEAEDDDGLRERIAQAPERFSTAGSVGAYRFHAQSAWAGIVDVAVVQPEMTIVNGELVSTNNVPPGQVRLYPLMQDGLPAPAVLTAVKNACSGEKVRPVCDHVLALSPYDIHTTIVAELVLYTSADADDCLRASQAALDAYIKKVRSKLGVDVVRLHIADALKVAGVYDVNVLQPANNIILEAHHWPVFDAVQVTVAGAQHG